jgi:hypothetical protein
LKNLALHCEFRDPDDEVRGSVVGTCIDNQLKKKYLSEKNLTLEKVLSIGKQYGAVLSQVEEMNTNPGKDEKSTKETIITVNQHTHKHRSGGKYSKRNQNKLCFKCG